MRLEDWRDQLAEMWSPLEDQCAFAATVITGSDRQHVGFHDGDWFEVGSTFKAFVAAEYARQVVSGIVDPTTEVTVHAEDRVDSSVVLETVPDGESVTLQAAAEAMIAVSDNTATDLLLRAVGVDEVRKLLARMGLTDTTVPDTTRSIYERFKAEPGWWPVACLTTMRDLTTFYAAVVAGGALGSAEATDRFLRLMRQEDIAQGSAWPDGVLCYRKSGMLEPPPLLAMGMAGTFARGDRSIATFAFALNVASDDDAAHDDSPLEPLVRTFSEGVRFGLHGLAEG